MLYQTNEDSLSFAEFINNELESYAVCHVSNVTLPPENVKGLGLVATSLSIPLASKLDVDIYLQDL